MLGIWSLWGISYGAQVHAGHREVCELGMFSQDCRYSAELLSSFVRWSSISEQENVCGT